MKLLTLALSFLLAFSVLAKTPTALFSPHEGVPAFEKMYDMIKSAKNYAHMTIYSWSDSGLDKAMQVALKNDVKVKIVLHPSLAKKARTKAKVDALEANGAVVKIARQNMHEKFLVVDGEKLMNTSANMSSGPKKRYSENWIFHEKTEDPESANNALLRQFRHEFTILWNSGKDMITHGEANAEALTDYTKKDENGNPINFIPEVRTMTLYSSSMNFTISPYKVSSKQYKTGKYIKLSRRGGKKNQTWVVRDVLTKAIDNAKKSILLGLNHFNIRSVSDALIRAVKRGVVVKLAVDNQEFKSRPNNKEMTPQFVQDWKKLPGNAKKVPPVRVKFYSHAPSPRHWHLNHHKFILVDYNKTGKGTTLLSGSYNISRTAEHNQFDNMVVYKSKEYKTLFTRFHGEFQNLWSMNRTAKDKPNKKILNKFFTPVLGAYPLHSSVAMALSWKEVSQFKSKSFKKFRRMFKGLYRKRDCAYYKPSTNTFHMYSSKTNKLSPCVTR